jgi:hypothetical protein
MVEQTRLTEVANLKDRSLRYSFSKNSQAEHEM